MGYSWTYTVGERGFGSSCVCVWGPVLRASVLKVTLSSFLCVFLTGEFQPKPSLLGDNSSSGQERDQFADGTDALHSGFMNYIKVRWCGSTHIHLLGTLEFRFKDFSPTFQSPLTVCSGSFQHVCVWQWELAPTLLVSEWFGVYICFSLVSFFFFFLIWFRNCSAPFASPSLTS